MSALRVSLIAITLALTSLASAQPSRPSDIPPRPAGDLLAVMGNRLHGEYLDNPIAADIKYKDKWIRVSGFGRVVQEDGANSFVMGVAFNRGNRELAGVYCRLAKSAEKDFARPIRDTDSVSVEGYCRGKATVYGAYKDFGVILDGCTLVK